MSTYIHPDTPDAAAVRDAIGRLAPDTPARWGKLDAPGMLEHLTRFNEIYLGRLSPSWFVRTMAGLIGGFFVRKFLARSPFDTPKSMRTLPDLQVEAGSVDPAGFSDLRARLLSTFDEIEAITGTWNHPLYGRIDAEVGRALARHHAAHHLNQFGVLGQPSSAGR